MRIGIVGLGVISKVYLETLREFAETTVTAVADLVPERASAVVGARATSVDEIYTAPDVDLILNLTIPTAHSAVARSAIAGGKHVYGEKPLAISTVESREILSLAENAGVQVGCAPDSVLGTGVQTARATLDSGGIGAPFAATAFMTTPGHERWHPDPEFYYRHGGGPLMDMGPYYISALVTLLGPVRRVVGMASTPQATRTIGSGPRAGTVFPVEVATHVTGVLEHNTGALSTMMMSFGVWAGQLPRIEIYGTEGALSVPDPNGFEGTVSVFHPSDPQWSVVQPSAGYLGANRGCGVVDMVRAIDHGMPSRASGELAHHVLDVMESLLAAADSGKSVDVLSMCDRPAAVPLGGGD
ncbi:Gfo/Idh/MocA family oxidoreductase [Kibdelosporangium philippinense]|uniref:Gfo/Idh/MocA family oxidoreductase n=1 Tax=Kibdelosporangium philippinense TaxID=211113 RepID=A0ABS8Z5Q3_9PSEU|nr:Gfo/Idh/MocA family oxidoreductase [Kibdelosporangium philippinense]MCE7002767.1 Gfo/Idh/MocA family oxidoreductase [Kibdelosporangium philippinense]